MIKSFLKGIVIGIANIVPGVSGGISAVTVTDCTGKKPYSLNVLGVGAPTAAKKSNCFLKDNLIK